MMPMSFTVISTLMTTRITAKTPKSLGVSRRASTMPATNVPSRLITWPAVLQPSARVTTWPSGRSCEAGS